MFQTIEDAIGGVSTVPEEKKAVFIKDATNMNMPCLGKS